MTVTSTNQKVSFSGNGSTTVFAYNFKVFAETDLLVILRSSTGTETTQNLTSNYTVSGVGVTSGGNVTMGTAPASGTTLVIQRVQPQLQGLDLVPNDPFPAQSMEDALDKLVFNVQTLNDEVGRSIKASTTNVISSTEFSTSASDRANKLLGFDGSGNLDISQEIGIYRGNWSASTSYNVRDLVKDTSTNKIFICITAHTSSGSQPLTSNTDSAKWDVLVDVSNPAGGMNITGNIVVSGNGVFGGYLDIAGDIDVDGTTNLDAVDIDGNVQIDGELTVGGSSQGYDVTLYGTSGGYIEWLHSQNTLFFRGNKISVGSFDDFQIYNTGTTTYLETNGSRSNQIILQNNQEDSDIRIRARNKENTNTVDYIQIDASEGIIYLKYNGASGIRVDANLTYFYADIEANGKVTATGTSVFANLDISGDVDIDGTLEADAITVNGTALATVIAGTTVTNATNSAHVLVTDNESTNEENLISFVEGATSSTGNVGLEMDGNFTYNPSTGTVTATVFKGNIDAVDGDFDGTLEADAITIGGTAVGSIFSPIAGGSGIVTTGALNSGSITSGFGDINNGASNITTTGVGTFASLDISGNIDVDGTTNLDAVDIDGAVDIASSIKAVTYQETYVAKSAASTVTCDLATGTSFSVTLDQNTTFAFTNPPSSGTAFSFTLFITQPSSAVTIAWPASVDWAGGSAPAAPGNSEVNAYGFYTRDGGTTYYGFLGGAALG